MRADLIDLARTAGRADAVVAFVPEASMGTALEMWKRIINSGGHHDFAADHNWWLRVFRRACWRPGRVSRFC